MFPGLALLATTLAFNLFGDSVRDASTPATAACSLRTADCDGQVPGPPDLLGASSCGWWRPSCSSCTSSPPTTRPAHRRQGGHRADAGRHRGRLGLDRPLIDQYGSYFWRLLHGDFGYSYVNSGPVSTIVGRDLPVTVSLAVGGAVIWLVIGVLAGVLGVHQAPVAGGPHRHGAGPVLLLDADVPAGRALSCHCSSSGCTCWATDLFPGPGYVGLTQSVAGGLST